MRALLPLRVKVKNIPPEDYDKQIGCLAGMKGFQEDAEGASLSGGEEEQEFSGKGLKGEQTVPEEFPGEMLVMAGIAGNRLDQVLRAIRKTGISVPYKAVLTASNQSWNAWELFAEIKKEHEVMAGNGVEKVTL